MEIIGWANVGEKGREDVPVIRGTSRGKKRMRNIPEGKENKGPYKKGSLRPLGNV